MNSVAMALDPNRSYWQRWNSPLMLDMVEGLNRDVIESGMPLSIWSVLRALLLPPDAKIEDIKTTAILNHARIRAHRAGRPLYVLDADAAHALAETDIPEGSLGSLRLPHEGFFLALPVGMFEMEDPTTGLHSLEGIHVCESLITPELSSASVPVGPAVDMVLVGKAKGSRVAWLGYTEPDDTIRFATLGAWSDASVLSTTGADKAALHIVVNLLWALENGYLEAEKVVPKSPKSPGKLKVLARRGYGLHPYTVIRLGKKAKSASAEASSPSGSKVKAHTVRGYWNRYWVLVAEGPTYGEKTREDGKKLFSIRKWIPPSKRGEGETLQSRQYRVRL